MGLYLETYGGLYRDLRPLYKELDGFISYPCTPVDDMTRFLFQCTWKETFPCHSPRTPSHNGRATGQRSKYHHFLGYLQLVSVHHGLHVASGWAVGILLLIKH